MISSQPQPTTARQPTDDDPGRQGHGRTAPYRAEPEQAEQQQAQPTWDQMGDNDRGAALLHLWKRGWEGDQSAVANHPCRYLEHPTLVALSPARASAHALRVCGSLESVVDRLGEEEFHRLSNLALAKGRRRRPST